MTSTGFFVIVPNRGNIGHAMHVPQVFNNNKSNKRKLSFTELELDNEELPCKMARGQSNPDPDDGDSDPDSGYPDSDDTSCSTCLDGSEYDSNSDYDADQETDSSSDNGDDSDPGSDDSDDSDFFDSDYESDDSSGTDMAPMEPFLQNGVVMVYDNVTCSPRRRVPQDDFTGRDARRWYEERVRREMERMLGGNCGVYTRRSEE
jgi:hypothetical protein